MKDVYMLLVELKLKKTNFGKLLTKMEMESIIFKIKKYQLKESSVISLKKVKNMALLKRKMFHQKMKTHVNTHYSNLKMLMMEVITL